MTEIKLYDNLTMGLPDTYEAMEQEEKQKYYKNVEPDHAYIDRSNLSFICVMAQDRELKKEDVKGRVAEYQAFYARMVPGFQMGQMALRKTEKYNIGVFTYKANATDRDTFNFFAVMNHGEKELIMNMTGDMKDAMQLFQKFQKSVESIRVVNEKQ